MENDVLEDLKDDQSHAQEHEDHQDQFCVF